MTAQPLEIATPASVPPQRGGPWKFWGTTLWGLAIIATMVVVGSGGTFTGLLWLKPDPNLTMPQLEALILSNSVLLSVIFGAAIACALAVLLLAVRLSGLGARDYLGLTLPRRRDLLIGLAAVVVLYAVYLLLSRLFAPHAPDWFIGVYRHSLGADTALALAVAIVLLAPLGEELIVRGFLLRGWAASRMGPTFAIVLTAALWTGMHTQYEPFVLSYIFGIGLLFGWLRQRTGSTLLTMMLHATQNAVVLAQTALTVWWLG